MIVYIAGPMRGIPDHNFPAFFAAQDRLEEAGHVALNPASMDQNIDGFDETEALEVYPVDTYIQRDVAAILTADAILCLPGWRGSKGATAEAALAKWRDLPRLDADTLETCEWWM